MPASPVDAFREALRAKNVARVRTLLEQEAEVRAAVNAPIGAFGGRPLSMVKTHLPMVDLLIAHGADLNLKSDWWAGPFGLLELGCTPEQAAPLIERGAIVDIFAAAHLGMADRVRELVREDPAVVHARGGDGKTALHCARTVDIAALLLDHGAAIDARDVDHESTAAQYLVREQPDVTRVLIDRGAWIDIFIAVGLGDPGLADRCLREDAEALDHRIGQGLYRVAHDDRHASAPEQIGNRRGDIYRWVFEHHASAIDAARLVGDEPMAQRLLERATPVQQLLSACAQGDRTTAEALVSAHTGLVTALRPDQMRLMADKAHDNDTAAVQVMADLGFDPLARGADQAEALRWAAFHGNATLVRHLLPLGWPIGARDPQYQGTLVGWCLHGSVCGWHRKTGDFAAALSALLEAGERPNADQRPVGRADVDAVLGPYRTPSPD